MAATSSATSSLISNTPVRNPKYPIISQATHLSLSSKISLSPSISLLSNRKLRYQLTHVTPRTPTITSSLDAKPTVLVAEKLGEAGLDLLKTVANVDCSYNLTQEDLCTKISLCDALIVRSGTKVTREVFESSGGRLKVVGRAGVRIDNVDLAHTVAAC